MRRQPMQSKRMSRSLFISAETHDKSKILIYGVQNQWLFTEYLTLCPLLKLMWLLRKIHYVFLSIFDCVFMQWCYTDEKASRRLIEHDIKSPASVSFEKVNKCRLTQNIQYFAHKFKHYVSLFIFVVLPLKLICSTDFMIS